MTTAQDGGRTAQDGGRVVSLTNRPPLPPGNTPGTLFCYSALLVGRSRDRFPVLSLAFSVTYFLPTVPWPWGRLSP